MTNGGAGRRVKRVVRNAEMAGQKEGKTTGEEVK